MHLFITQFIHLCYTENSASLLEDLLMSEEVAWSKSKFYLPYSTASSLSVVNYWQSKTSLP